MDDLREKLEGLLARAGEAAEYHYDTQVIASAHVRDLLAELEAAQSLQAQEGGTSKLEGDDRLFWGVVANAGRLSRERKVRWSHVMDATSMGSTSSAALCRRFGFAPGETVGIEDQDEADDVTASPAQPSGFVLVPHDPTPEMIEAGIMFGTSPNKATIIFQSMVNAAPAPIEQEG